MTICLYRQTDSEFGQINRSVELFVVASTTKIRSCARSYLKAGTNIYCLFFIDLAAVIVQQLMICVLIRNQRGTNYGQKKRQLSNLYKYLVTQ